MHLTQHNPPTPTPQRNTTAMWAVCYGAASPRCHSDTPCREACLLAAAVHLPKCTPRMTSGQSFAG